MSVENVIYINEDDYDNKDDNIQNNDDKCINCENIQNNDDKCINCESVNTIKHNKSKGYMVCDDCGVIQNNVMEIKNDKPFYSENNNGSSNGYGCPSNSDFPNSSLGTRISGSTNNLLVKIHNWNAIPYNERALWNVYNEIDNICKQYGIPNTIIIDSKNNYNIVNKAKHLSGKNKGKKKITRGNNKHGLKGVSVYYACKKNNYPISVKEIEKMFSLKKSLSKACKIYEELLNFNVLQQMELLQISPVDYVSNFCKKLSIGIFYCEISKEIAKNAEKIDIIYEHTAQSMAAGSIYFMVKLYDLNLTKKQISDVCLKSEVTIIKIYKKMLPYTEHLMPNKEKLSEIIDKHRGTRVYVLKPKVFANNVLIEM